MNKRIFTCIVVSMLLAGSASVVLAADSAASTKDAKQLFPAPLKWKSTDVLVKPVSDEKHKIVSVKDPTIVRYDGLWHIYATAYSTSARTWSMVYLNFKDWADAPKAKLTYIDINPKLRGYHCAPHVFYFTPHKKWYLIFQSQQPQYCTTDDISRPETWTAPQDFFQGKPEGAPRLWIDYHIICDDTHAYLFFTGDNGRFYRSRTTVEDFPKGMSNPEIAIENNRNNLFEGSITYKIKDSDYYLTLIEALSPARYYRAWISDRLNGQWTPVPGADTWETPFAGINNVTFEEGVKAWTRDISHGELIRDGYDETMTVDLNNLQFLFQGRDPNSGGDYSLLPYRLGLLRAIPRQRADGAKPKENRITKPAVAAGPRFLRTRVIGFSQVGQLRGGWFVSGGVFESIVGDDRWELLWANGAGVDRWRDPNFTGWSISLVSPCPGDAPVDRVLLSVSGPYGNNEQLWAEAIEATVATIRKKIPTARQIVLQAVVGGPDGKVCTAPASGRGFGGGTEVRASRQHPHIVNAINAVVKQHVGGEVQITSGYEPKVRSCDDYADALGHLTHEGAAAVAKVIGEYYASLDAD